MINISGYVGFHVNAVTDRLSSDDGNFHNGNNVPIGSRTSSVLSSKYLKSIQKISFSISKRYFCFYYKLIHHIDFDLILVQSILKFEHADV